jgi:hypothetical protein
MNVVVCVGRHFNFFPGISCRFGIECVALWQSTSAGASSGAA